MPEPWKEVDDERGALRDAPRCAEMRLDAHGCALSIGTGMVGQEKAREAAGVVVELIGTKKMAGRATVSGMPTVIQVDF